MVDLSDIIARVEAASGPDREIDLAIHLALYPGSDIANLMRYGRGLDAREGYAWGISGGAVVFEKWDVNGRCPFNGGYPLPFYTASIDAALTLLPGGWGVIRIERTGDTFGGFVDAIDTNAATPRARPSLGHPQGPSGYGASP